MADGRLVMNPAEARAKASEMKNIANELETLLNAVSRKMQEIDNTETGIYQGSRRPAQLREELDSFRATFNLAHEQIVKSANDIITIANTAEAE